MADFPDAIYAPRTMANRPGVSYDALKTKVIFAEDFNLDRAEIVAIENTLGTNPEGTYTTVGDRLDGIEGQLNPTISMFSVALDADQSVNSASITQVEFDTVQFDENSDFDVDTYRFYAPVNGYYFTSVLVRFSAPVADKYCYARIRLNGSAVVANYCHTSNTNQVNANVNVTLYMTAGQYIDVVVYHNFGSAKDIDSGSGATRWVGYLVKAV